MVEQQHIFHGEADYQSLFEYSPISIWVEDFSAVQAFFNEKRRAGIGDFRRYFNQHPEDVLMLAGAIKIVDVNQKCLEFLELERKEDLVLNLPHYFTEDSLGAFQEELVALAEGKCVFDTEMATLTRTGKCKNLALNLRVSSGSEDTLERVIVSFIDITPHKQVEQALRESETHYRIVADNTYDWEFWISPTGEFLYSSPSCERITGYPAQVFMGDPGQLLRIIHPEDRELYKSHRHNSVTNQLGGQVIFRIRRADGSERWVEHICQPVFNEAGEYLGERGSNRDFTERKQAEKVREELEVRREMDVLRDELIGNVSHELRTPLGLIMVMVTALLNQDLSLAAEARRSFLEDIEAETRKLQAIVANLLDIANLSSGRMALVRKPLDLGKLVHKEIQKISLQKPGHTFVFMPPQGMVLAELDVQRIEQVLRNLLDNASKYSKPGTTITVAVSAAPGSVKVVVSDEGVGIPENDAERIFERFYRISSPGVPGVAGLGLGLSISRGIIEAHNGRLWAENRPEGGSRFIFTIPA